MASSAGHLETAAALAVALEEAGHEPVLVGGMALVILGSQRVTNDFDFLISSPKPLTRRLVNLMYRHGFELITKLGPTGEVVRTVDSSRVAAIKIKMEDPRTLPFFNHRVGLRVDLMQDFPLPAHGLSQNAAKVRLSSGTIRVAAPPDLLKLKKIAYADRKSAADAQDLEFLRNFIKKSG